MKYIYDLHDNLNLYPKFLAFPIYDYFFFFFFFSVLSKISEWEENRVNEFVQMH